MEADPRSIRLTRGQAWSETWQFLDDAEEPIDLTGLTGELLISASTAGGTLATGTWTPGETIGEAVLALTEEQVTTMDGHRVGHWLLRITDPLGEDHDARGTLWMVD